MIQHLEIHRQILMTLPVTIPQQLNHKLRLQCAFQHEAQQLNSIDYFNLSTSWQKWSESNVNYCYSAHQQGSGS